MDQLPVPMDDIRTAEVISNNSVSISQLESFITELDQLLQVKSSHYGDNQIEKNNYDIDLSKYEKSFTTAPQKKIRTRNVKGIYRREHAESKNMELKAKTTKKAPKDSSNIAGKVLTTEGNTSNKLLAAVLKPEIACKGGFVLLPKLIPSTLPLSNTGKLPILPIISSSRKSLVIKPRLLLPKK